MAPRLGAGCDNCHNRKFNFFYRSRGGLFLKTRLDQLRQPGDIGNDKCAVSAFDQTSAGQRAQFARYRLTVGADAASDVGMGWYWRDDCRVSVQSLVARQPQQLALNAVSHRQYAKLDDAVRQIADQTGEVLHHLRRDVWMVVQDASKGHGRHRSQDRIAERDDRCGARRAIDRRHLAEALSGGQVGKGNLLSGRRKDRHAHPAADDEIDVVGLVLMTDDKLMGGIPVPPA